MEFLPFDSLHHPPVLNALSSSVEIKQFAGIFWFFNLCLHSFTFILNLTFDFVLAFLSAVLHVYRKIYKSTNCSTETSHSSCTTTNNPKSWEKRDLEIQGNKILEETTVWTSFMFKFFFSGLLIQFSYISLHWRHKTVHKQCTRTYLLMYLTTEILWDVLFWHKPTESSNSVGPRYAQSLYHHGASICRWQCYRSSALHRWLPEMTVVKLLLTSNQPLTQPIIKVAVNLAVNQCMSCSSGTCHIQQYMCVSKCCDTLYNTITQWECVRTALITVAPAADSLCVSMWAAAVSLYCPEFLLKPTKHNKPLLIYFTLCQKYREDIVKFHPPSKFAFDKPGDWLDWHQSVLGYKTASKFSQRVSQP